MTVGASTPTSDSLAGSLNRVVAIGGREEKDLRETLYLLSLPLLCLCSYFERGHVCKYFFADLISTSGNKLLCIISGVLCSHYKTRNLIVPRFARVTAEDIHDVFYHGPTLAPTELL